MTAQAQTGSCPQKSFCGSDMRAAYYEATTLTGKGQNIGLLEFLGYDIADVNTYYKGAKQKRVGAIKGISTDGTPLQCLYSQGCDDTEQTLDITQTLGMAPSATVYMYVGSSDTAILGSMVSHKPLPLQLSASWGWGPPVDPKTDDPYFKKMAAQGQSFLKGAGDLGNWNTGSYECWPCDDPYLTSVGGTDLKTKGAGKGWASETVWCYGYQNGCGGGGISPNDFSIPKWQKLSGVITKANKGSTKYRNGPDVSANADYTFYVCADQTGLSGCTANLYGGVSFAIPMWAGYIALANEQAAEKGKKPVGFINPTIYSLGVGKNYHTDFHDITSGSNGYPATKGYDLASGWGSPNTDGLINALTGSK